MILEYLELLVQVVIKFITHLMGDRVALLLVVELLEHFAKMTENTLDDEIVAIIKNKLVLKQD